MPAVTVKVPKVWPVSCHGRGAGAAVSSPGAVGCFVPRPCLLTGLPPLRGPRPWEVGKTSAPAPSGHGFLALPLRASVAHALPGGTLACNYNGSGQNEQAPNPQTGPAPKSSATTTQLLGRLRMSIRMLGGSGHAPPPFDSPRVPVGISHSRPLGAARRPGGPVGAAWSHPPLFFPVFPASPVPPAPGRPHAPPGLVLCRTTRRVRTRGGADA